MTSSARDNTQPQPLAEEAGAPANGQTVGERKIDIDRLEAVLQGMILMLRDNPDLPLPWAVDFSATTDPDSYARFVERHGLDPYGHEREYAQIGPLAERYSCAEDRAGFYLPWSLGAERKDRPL